MSSNYMHYMARYGGLAAVFFELLALVLFFLIAPELFDGRSPISGFAALAETRAVFSVCLSLAAVSFFIFVRYCLSRSVDTPVKLFTFSMFGYAALAVTPFNPDDKLSDLVHRALALAFTLSFLLGMYLIGKSNSATKEVRLVSYGAASVSLVMMVAFLSMPKNSVLVLPLESASIVACQAWVLFMTRYCIQAETHSYRG